MAIIKLGDVVEIKSQKRIYQKDWTKNGVLFIKVEDIIKLSNNPNHTCKTFISNELYNDMIAKYEHPKKGDILLTTGGSVGEVWEYDGRPCWFKDSAIRWFKNDETIILNKYLMYWFKINKKLILSKLGGSVMMILTSSTINNFQINVPSLEEQRKIIDIIEPKEYLYKKYSNIINIDSYDSFIKSWTVLIDIIEPLEQNILLFEKKIKEIISIGINIGVKYDEIYKLKDLGDVWAGSAPPQIQKFWNNGTIPFLNINNLTNNPIINEANIFLNEVGFKKSNCKLTTKNDILIGKVSPDRNKISLSNGEFVVNGAIRVFSSFNRENRFQIYFRILNEDFKIRAMAHGAVQQQLNSNQLENLEIKFDKKLNNFYNKLGKLLVINISLKNKLKDILNKLINKNIK